MRRQYDPRVEREIRALGALCKARRADWKIGVREAAAQIGTSKDTVSRLEQGRVIELHQYLLVNDWLQRGPFGAAPLTMEKAS